MFSITDNCGHIPAAADCDDDDDDDDISNALTRTLHFSTRFIPTRSHACTLACSEYVELSREERLGPGGLDPVEVFESLPPDLQKCFETEDIPMLKRVRTRTHMHILVLFFLV